MLAEHQDRLMPFQRFFEALAEPIAIVDPRGGLVSANRSLLTRIGLSEDALRGHDLKDLVAPEHRVLLTAFIDWYFRTHAPGGFHSEAGSVEFGMPLDLSAVAFVESVRQSESQSVTGAHSPIDAVLRWALLPDANGAAVTFRFAPEDSGRVHPAQTPTRAPDVIDLSVNDPEKQASAAGDSRMPSVRLGRAPLSLREREIVQLVLDGNRVSTIASRLFLSENTVRNHLKRVYRKLGVSSLGELRESVGSNQRAS